MILCKYSRSPEYQVNDMLLQRLLCEEHDTTNDGWLVAHPNSAVGHNGEDEAIHLRLGV